MGNPDAQCFFERLGVTTETGRNNLQRGYDNLIAQGLSAEQRDRVDEAFQTLSDWERREIYLLIRAGQGLWGMQPALLQKEVRDTEVPWGWILLGLYVWWCWSH